MSAGNDGLNNEERVAELNRQLTQSPNTQAHIAGSVTSPTELTLFCHAVSRELKRFIESADNRETLEAWALADICHASHLLDIFHDQAIVREIEVNP